MFNPNEYIKVINKQALLCRNPVADGGVCSITINRTLSAASKAEFRASVRRMVLTKLFSPKFAEVILTALDKETVDALERRVA